MPSDNLEKYIKEKLEAVQHTPPPGNNWDPEATWLRMQQPPVLTRRKKLSWLHYAAAIFVVALLAGLTWQYWTASQQITKPIVATTPAKEILPQTSKLDPIVENLTKQPGSNINAINIPDQHKPQIAAGQKRKQSVKLPSLQVVSTNSKQSPYPASARVVDAPTTASPGIPAVNLVAEEPTLAQTTAQPLKITVVLGKTSTAKMLNQTANNLSAKRIKTRLRLNVPGSENTDKGHLASVDSSYQPLKLQARIDL